MSTSSARYKPAGGGGIQPRYDPYSVPHQPYNGSSSTAAKYQQSARHLRRQPTATISVGGDDWANQVINNVVGSLNHAPGDYYSSDINNDTHHSQSEVDAAVVLEKIAEKKRKFHADRTLELKNLPDGATEQDIRLALPDVDIIRVELDRMDVRHRPGAKLYLKHSHILDAWPAHRDSVYVRNKEVNLCLGTSDKWLCVARLPLNYTEEQLTSLMAPYGRIKHSFLICSEVTGESKGYGLVKYESQEAAAQAKQFVNGSLLEDEAIQVDWLNSSFIQYSQLHSKCLYVSNLPPNFRDLAQFRKIFSVVKNPPYCQIAMKNGVLQNWGLVEFFDHNDAERTQQEIDGYNLKGSNIRVLYCIPGVNAINIYMSLVTSADTVSKKGLVDEVPSSTVYAQLQKLGTQNPAFAQNLQNIIQNHIDKSNNPSGTLQPDNPHDQAALMILMAAQHQEEAEKEGGSSLLQNQEVVEVLQNLVCGSRGQQQHENDIDPYAQLLSIPSLQVVLGHHQPQLPTGNSPPPAIVNNLNLLNNTQTLNEMLGSLQSKSDGQLDSVASTQEIQPVTKPPLIAETPPDFSRPPPSLMPPSLATHPPLPPPATKFLTPPPPMPPMAQSPPISLPTPHRTLSPLLANPGMFVQATTSQCQVSQSMMPTNPLFTSPPVTAQMPIGSPFLNYPGIHGVPGLPGHYMPGLEGLLTPPIQHHTGLVMSSPQPTMFFNPLTGGIIPGLPPNMAGLLQLPQLAVQHPSLTMPPPASPNLPPPPPIAPPTSRVVGIPSPPPQGLPPPHHVVTSTPQSMKRKASILPNPEESPEGRRYIGQHSQGLGGHYAESYWSNKRTKYN